MGIRVLVCGGRNFTAEAFIERKLLNILGARPKVDLFITGGAKGADQCADHVAEIHGVQRVIVPANWVGRDRAAGMERNKLMLDLFKPDLVIAFPGGAGTAGMVRIAQAAGIETIVVVANIG